MMGQEYKCELRLVDKQQKGLLPSRVSKRAAGFTEVVTH